MKLNGITLKRLGKEYGIYKKQPKCKEPYLTRNAKFLCWLPAEIALEDNGTLTAIDGWNRQTQIA